MAETHLEERGPASPSWIWRCRARHFSCKSLSPNKKEVFPLGFLLSRSCRKVVGFCQPFFCCSKTVVTAAIPTKAVTLITKKGGAKSLVLLVRRQATKWRDAIQAMRDWILCPPVAWLAHRIEGNCGIDMRVLKGVVEGRVFCLDDRIREKTSLAGLWARDLHHRAVGQGVGSGSIGLLP